MPRSCQGCWVLLCPRDMPHGLCWPQDVSGDKDGSGPSASTFLQLCLSPPEVWPSASSSQPPSSSLSSPLSWWVAMCRRWCAGAGRVESYMRWAWACSSSEGAEVSLGQETESGGSDSQRCKWKTETGGRRRGVQLDTREPQASEVLPSKHLHPPSQL